MTRGRLQVLCLLAAVLLGPSCADDGPEDGGDADVRVDGDADADSDADADADTDTDADVDADADADADEPLLRCGETTCDPETTYCHMVISTTVGGEGTIECATLPAACLVLDPGCDCFGLRPTSGCVCREAPADVFLVQCRE